MTLSSPNGAVRALGVLLLCFAAPARGQDAVVRGTVTYEKIRATRDGLKLDAPAVTAAGGVRVEVIDEAGAVVGATFADSMGAFAVALDRPGRVRVRVRAEAENARVVRVSDRTPYELTSPVVVAAAGDTVAQDLFAPDRGRASGAFNIAATIARANRLIRSVQPAVSLPAVEVRWDTAYVAGTFFRYSERVAYINGNRRRDSDEFDDHVVLHEYAHFLMASLSREDSPGGDHGVGERLDPRLAWSEGWADFFAAVVTGDPVYIDTGMIEGRQGVRVVTDLEEDVHPRDRPGIWSEHSVGSALWDWYDDAVEPTDSVSIPFARMWAAFSGPLRKTPDVHLMDFVEALARDGVPLADLAQVLNARGISYPQVRQRFSLPITSGVPVEGVVDSRATFRSNLVGSSAHYTFHLRQEREVSASMKITAARDPRRADLDLILFDAKGSPLARSDAVNGVGGAEDIVRRLPPGYYRLEVRSWSAPAESRLGDANAHQGAYQLIVRY